MVSERGNSTIRISAEKINMFAPRLKILVKTGVRMFSRMLRSGDITIKRWIPNIRSCLLPPTS
uniref:Uncharacterized protein n=1 Tax=Megaselia scalaris TaxID=36166 RepID=T1GIZ4_MEGSC